MVSVSTTKSSSLASFSTPKTYCIPPFCPGITITRRREPSSPWSLMTSWSFSAARGVTSINGAVATCQPPVGVNAFCATIHVRSPQSVSPRRSMVNAARTCSIGALLLTLTPGGIRLSRPLLAMPYREPRQRDKEIEKRISFENLPQVRGIRYPLEDSWNKFNGTRSGPPGLLACLSSSLIAVQKLLTPTAGTNILPP